MTRMDEAGAQLDGLARLYHDAGDKPDFESLANLVAERTSDAMSRKAPAPVAMFGPESLKTIEDRISSLVRSVSKGPDAETLASLVAEKTSAAFAKSGGAPVPVLNPEGFDALEKRMTAVFNTAGKDTAERLARLEAALSSRATAPAPARAEPAAPAPQPPKPQSRASEFDAAVEEPSTARLDSILSSLNGQKRADAMPSNPADEAPLVDRGFADVPRASAQPQAPAPRPAAPAPQPARPVQAEVQPAFDPEKVDRPPRPQSSFAQFDREGFAAPARADASAPAVEAPVSNTSTFVAAARRAQRARQEQQVAEPASGNSLIGRALARVRPQPKAAVAEDAAPAPTPEPKAEKRRPRKPAPEAPVIAAGDEAAEATPNFLVRNRRTLLLALAVVAVSMLTLNLVMQRMRPAPAPAQTSSTETVPTSIPVDPTPAAEMSELVAPRVIDMVDATAVGSINPGERMSFTRATETPMPPTLLAQDASGAGAAALKIITDDTTPATGSIAAAAPEQFELPPEALGPLPLRQAAADGDAKAQFEIAAIYTEGRAVEASPEEAAKWYERSAAQGFVPAQYRLGNLYEAGTGVEKDLEMARLWYQRAAEAGNRMAMHNLAALYASGQLGEQQFEEAGQWFTQAATLGMVDSQFNLGMLYARGLGVEQDFEQSYKWFSLAAKSGDADAAKARDDIAKSLSADAASRIGSEVQTWTSEPIALSVNFAPIGTWAPDFDPGEAIANKEVVSRVQQALNRLGFNVGTPDGVAGPKTAEAIRTFERGTGMSESGTINPRLLAVLGSQPV
ncbi:peptidoglycan-binding protein [Devosia riboflavina]